MGSEHSLSFKYSLNIHNIFNKTCEHVPSQQTHNVNTTLYNVVRGLFSQRCEKDMPATLPQHKMTTLQCNVPTIRGVGRGGSEGSDDPPFLGANFIHFLYKVLGQRSVQK